jgi:hypothetical protein
LIEGSRAAGIGFVEGVCGIEEGADVAEFRGLDVFEAAEGN